MDLIKPAFAILLAATLTSCSASSAPTGVAADPFDQPGHPVGPDEGKGQGRTEAEILFPQLADRVGRIENCRAFLRYQRSCASANGDGPEDGQAIETVLLLKATQMDDQALGAYCRDMHQFWQRQGAGQCPTAQ